MTTVRGDPGATKTANTMRSIVRRMAITTEVHGIWEGGASLLVGQITREDLHWFVLNADVNKVLKNCKEVMG